MTIDLPVARARTMLPLRPSSGCEATYAPSITSVTVCSLPELTSPDSAPRPIVFNIPQLPPQAGGSACIDIKLKVNKKKSNLRNFTVNGTPTFVMTLKTDDDEDDCMAGKYKWSMNLTVPCYKLTLEGGSGVRISHRGDPYDPCVDRFRIEVSAPFSGINGVMTMLNGATRRQSGLFVRFGVIRYSNGIAVEMTGWRRMRGAAKSASGPDSRRARAPDYAMPGEWIKLLGFTRCSNAK